MKLDFKKFKKVAEGEHSTKLQSPDGHVIEIAHKALHPATRGQLAALPMTKAADAAVAKMGNMKPAMAKGGKVSPPPQFSNPTQPNKTPATDMLMADGGTAGSPPEATKQNAADMQKGTQSGSTSASDAWKNLKSGLGYADGGMAGKELPVENLPEGYRDPSTQALQDPELTGADAAMAVAGGPLIRGAGEALAPVGKALLADEAGYIGSKASIKSGEELANAAQKGTANLAQHGTEKATQAKWMAERNALAAGAKKKAAGFKGYADGGEISPDQQVEAIPQEAMQPQQQQTPPEMMPQAAAQEQAAGAPPAAAPAAQNDPYGFGATQEAFQSGLAKTQSGLLQESMAAQDQAKAQADLLGQQTGVQAAQASDYQRHYKALDQERKALQADIANKHIDPNHYINSMNTGSRIATAIGLIASGMGGGMMGHGGNLAADFLHKQIENDINAQKVELGKKENLLSANMRQFGNMRDAMDMTRIMQSDILSNKLKQEAAKAAIPGAQANLLKASGDLDMKTAPLVGQMAMRKSLMSGMTAGRVAPEAVIRAVVPEAEQAGATKQLKEAQDAVSLRDHTLQDFDRLVKINTVENNLSSPIQTRKQVAAIKGAALDKLTKDISGRVTPETVHLIGGMFDTLGSDAKTNAVQRQKLNETLSNGMHYPELKKWGIDVDSLGQHDRNGQSRIIKAPITPIKR